MLENIINHWTIAACAYAFVGCLAMEAVGRYYQSASGTYRVRWRFLFAWPLLLILMAIYICMCLIDMLVRNNNR
jgi:hypothetical protein